MAKIKKKGTSGQAKNFITRTQAVRKLQIPLPDFRRLCIFKGIYPREPRSRKKASKTSTPSSTFYYTKDIQYLAHEPILRKFRDHKALSKKIGRALGRGEVGDASRLEKTHVPKITLDHIIKERYPTFVDALRDLDDALSMLFLFANLPSSAAVPPKIIALCQRLCLEFEHYLITTHSLRKSFLSIKGIYYQATIQGQDVLWLVPYKFVQQVTGDVDFRIMGTFVEFYTALLGFVNFRLYTSIGLVYPPMFSASSDEHGGELGAFTLRGRVIAAASEATEEPVGSGPAAHTTPQALASTQIEADRLANSMESAEEPDVPMPQDSEVMDDTVDKFEVQDQAADTLPQPSSLGYETANTLFAQCTFYLSRETPRHALEFLVKAFGCKRVGWDAVLGDGAFTTDEFDSRITHQIVDRPTPSSESFVGVFESSSAHHGSTDPPAKKHGYPHNKVLGRTYIQPQWVWDCINEGRLLRPDLYAPGATLPPHLSPWVKPEKGKYDPKAPLAEPEEEAIMIEAKSGGEMTVDDSVGGEANGESDDAARADVKDVDRASEEEEDTKDAHQAELEAEAAGLPFSAQTVKPPTKTLERNAEAARREKAAAEELERQRTMMSRKKRKVLDRMLHSSKRQDEETNRIRAKKRRIEKESGGR